MRGEATDMWLLCARIPRVTELSSANKGRVVYVSAEHYSPFRMRKARHLA